MNDYATWLLVFTRDYLTPLSVAIAAAAILLSPAFRRILTRSFFLSADSDDGPDKKDLLNKLQAMQQELASLKSQVARPLSEDSAKALRDKLDAELYSYIPSLVRKHLEGLAHKDDDLVRHFERCAEDAANKHLEALPFTELISHAIYREAWSSRREHVDEFAKAVERQISSANATKMVMMNLFVLFNITLLLAFVFYASNISDKVSLSIFGVYVSLSAFIIYIYRASNARAASLLSIKEDEKKLFDVFLFLSTFKKGNTFTNNEVEILRQLLVNRLERERGSDHPYEVILKGVTNSTVMLRGGKVTTAKATKSET